MDGGSPEEGLGEGAGRAILGAQPWLASDSGSQAGGSGFGRDLRSGAQGLLLPG